MLTLLLVAVLTLAHPPAAHLDTGRAQVPLAISAWCWHSRCGAPIAASKRIAHVRRNAQVTAVLGFTPTSVELAVAGKRVAFTQRGAEVTWRAGRAGGLTLDARSATGWVVYVGRIALG